ncbi:M20 aminoacylase family protein [Maritalea mediterranea]|uniref:M20 family metallopeptidase n=1 Tax=Maritalea mediterranea TaxID=2909667 RepID=A0ABS9E4C8_9HYPH|nr:M20 family metallopeptidase [Maritalea mediterranea]
MPIINRIAEFHDEITAWRRDFHEHPELLYDVHRTAGKVEELLKSFGCDEVVSGIGQTGVVGIIKGNKDSSGKVIGLRADMDALPIHEQTDKPYASKTPGKMHACGHDGHTAMLLGAAKYLAETRNFDGTVAVIFQPAEEGGAGGKAMVDDGMMDRFGIQEVFGMHNFPGIPVGEFAIREGGIMAAADMWNIKVVGVDSHAAMPHKSVDPIVVASHIVLALQSIVARNVDPVQSAVVSTTIINGGSAHNIIPMNVELAGTVRALDPEVRLQVKQRLISIAETVAAGFGAKAEVDYRDGYPVTMNAPDQTAFATEVAKKLVGDERVDANTEPSLGGEDFSFMSNARPGAFIFVGNGDTAGLHQDQYDFNDEIIPYGCSYWAQLVETAMPNS